MEWSHVMILMAFSLNLVHHDLWFLCTSYKYFIVFWCYCIQLGKSHRKCDRDISGYIDEDGERWMGRIQSSSLEQARWGIAVCLVRFCVYMYIWVRARERLCYSEPSRFQDQTIAQLEIEFDIWSSSRLSVPSLFTGIKSTWLHQLYWL